MTDKEEEQLIETVDEDGNKVIFGLLDIIAMDDKEYALLLPKFDKGHENSGECSSGREEEVLVMRIKRDGEDYSFEQIEDDDEFNRVARYIEEIEDEIDE